MKIINPTISPQLLAVMPVFNEEAAIEAVVRSWFAELDRTVADFELLVIDDGSLDGTRRILERLKQQLGSRLVVRSRENRGHGQTCLEGYREAVHRQIPHILQIDSDGQCDPSFFASFWLLREDYDVIYGKRLREDGIKRIMASYILRCLLKVRFGVDCIDANVPYRLMKTMRCRRAFDLIPEAFFLVNIALAVLLRMDPGRSHGCVPIRFLERFGGEPSVPIRKFGIKAIELCRQLDSLIEEHSPDTNTH